MSYGPDGRRSSGNAPGLSGLPHSPARALSDSRLRDVSRARRSRDDADRRCRSGRRSMRAMRAWLMLAACVPAAAFAQGIRISGVTTMQLVELRPLMIDSLPSSQVPGTGEIRTSADGVPAICPTSSPFCQFERSGNRFSVAPVLQDLTIAGWGLAQGLSFHSDLRARTQIGSSGSFVFPRTNDHFDVVDAYAQLDRSDWSARVGRQWVTGGLGAYGFDGGDGIWRHNAFTTEGWAGRALVGGLADPYTTGLLAAVDNLPPQQDG